MSEFVDNQIQAGNLTLKYTALSFCIMFGIAHCHGAAPFLTSTSQGVPASQPVQATSADAFVDSIGVATHWGYPSYASNLQSLENLLINSGIRHIRDGADPGVMTTLLPYGIRETVVINPIGGIVPNLSYWSGAPAQSTFAVGDYIKNHMPAGSVDALEMPNELDIFYQSYKWHPTDTSPLSSNPNDPNYYGAYGKAVTQDCWSAIKSDPMLSSILIVGPSVGVQVPSIYPAGSLYADVDFGNFHPYPGRTNTWTYPQPYDTITKYYWNSYQPSGNIGADNYGGNPLMFTWYQPPFANGPDSKPMMATETGYHTASVATGISVHAQAKYVPRLFAEYFRDGIARTFSYELYDEGADLSNVEDNFGLVYNNSQPKPAFTALSSMIALLKEPGASFVPGSLAYSLAVQPNGAYSRTGYVHDLLLEKSDGDFYLMLWHEVSDTSNTDTSGNLLTGPQRDIAPPALMTTVNLPSGITSATLFTYSSSWKLRQRNLPVIANTITLPVSDTISFIQLK